MITVEIYTDGACSGNPGVGGWCAILMYNGRSKVVSDTLKIQLTTVWKSLPQF